jgi:adenine-specific DNA-methyltransferase
MSNEQTVTTNIKVSDNDLEILKKHFPQCFDKNGNFQFEKFKKNLSQKEINFSTESYGLQWLGKSYARLLASDEATTLLRENEEHNHKPENLHAENLLIKGDNLEVLKHLANAYHEKIKMIYIDPPYNTGTDGFVYEDDRRFTVKELQVLAGVDEEQAKRILDFTQSHSNSHSAWLTFMYPRLYIARQLLKDDGVIFVSIDDNEVAQLRLLMDEIFGEENFVGEFIRKTKSMTGDKNTGLNTQQESLICYAKIICNILLEGEERTFDVYANTDNDPNGEWVSADPSAKSGGPSSYFSIINPYTGKIDLPPKGRYWAFSIETLNKYIESGKIKFKAQHNNNERGFIFKRYKNELESCRNPVNSLDFCENIFMNQVGTKELRELFNTDCFQNPKPKIFIKKIIYYATNTSDIILDFFAGSGTTGDAVMQLNADTSIGSVPGNRKFILVQLPEPIDPKKNKAAYDFVKNEMKAEPTIFEITKERLIRAANKINRELEEKNKTLESKIADLESQLPTDETKAEIENLRKQVAQNENLKRQNTFKIFETVPIWENYLFEAEDFDPQQELFDVERLTEEDIKALLVTWKTYDGISLTQDLKPIDFGGYTAYYGNEKLYLMNRWFTTETLKALLEKIDSDKDFDPKIIIAFGYHFESKNLRELSESVKHFNNKKNLDIDFIIRY